MIREMNPLPPPVKCVVVMPAPKINSLADVVLNFYGALTAFVADVVVTAPLPALVPVPAAPAVLSSGFAVSNPLYSSARTSTNAAAWLNVTVTVLLPAAMFWE